MHITHMPLIRFYFFFYTIIRYTILLIMPVSQQSLKSLAGPGPTHLLPNFQRFGRLNMTVLHHLKGRQVFVG